MNDESKFENCFDSIFYVRVSYFYEQLTEMSSFFLQKCNDYKLKELINIINVPIISFLSLKVKNELTS